MDPGIPKTLPEYNVMCSWWLLVFYKDPLKLQQVISEPSLLLDYWDLKLFDSNYTWIALVI